MPEADTNPKSAPELEPFDPATGDLNAVIETPKGSRNKFKYDPRHNVYTLSGVLPAGAVFPFDFGFVPNTLGDDGDALDVLLLMDEPAFAGCVIPSRLIGVIEAYQTEDGKTERNDRLVAVASNSHNHAHIKSFEDLSDNLLKEIEHFFVSYNRVKGKEFKPMKHSDPGAARKLVENGHKRRLKLLDEQRPNS